MALLVLRRVGLCVGQNQMCHLCGGNKIELKKCEVGKIKNTEGSAMSVGLLVVRLQYGLYVGHLSKFVTLFLFVKRSMSVVLCRFTLAANGEACCRWAIKATLLSHVIKILNNYTL